MSSNLAARLGKLEAELKVFSKSSVWVDMFDNRVRVDINHKRGEDLVFDTVRDCAAWLELQIAQFENVNGVACIGDVSELLEESAREPFDTIHEGAPVKGVVFGFAKAGRVESIASTAIASWWHSLSVYQEWRQEVEARVQALFNSLDGSEPAIQ